MSKKRRHFTAQQKVEAIKEHLINKTPVSDICDRLEITTGHYYQWQSDFFTNGEQAFVKENNKQGKLVKAKIEKFETDMAKRNEAIAELLDENIRLKKQHGLI